MEKTGGMSKDYGAQDAQASREDRIMEKHHWEMYRNSIFLIPPGLPKCKNPIHGPRALNVCENCAKSSMELHKERFCSTGCFVRNQNGTQLRGEREMVYARENLREALNCEPTNDELKEFVESQGKWRNFKK